MFPLNVCHILWSLRSKHVTRGLNLTSDTMSYHNSDHQTGLPIRVRTSLLLHSQAHPRIKMTPESIYVIIIWNPIMCHDRSDNQFSKRWVKTSRGVVRYIPLGSFRTVHSVIVNARSPASRQIDKKIMSHLLGWYSPLSLRWVCFSI
jgi:hypothetical protein